VIDDSNFCFGMLELNKYFDGLDIIDYKLKIDIKVVGVIF